MWQGPAKETARVPPLLDSPQSAAPETFLSRDAVSAFPLLFGPLPQPLPGVRCRGWAARERLPWRFCVNPSLPRSDRAGRRVLSPASVHNFVRCQRRIGIHAHVERAGPAKRKSALGLSSCRLETPRSASTPSSGGNLIVCRHFADLRKFACTRITLSSYSSTAPARFPAPARRDPAPPAAPWSAAGQFPMRARPCRPSRPHTSLRAGCAASPDLFRAVPAYAARSKLKCPVRPVSSRLPP